MAYEIASKIVSGRKVVDTPGTAVKLVDDTTYCYRVDISADLGNKDAVVVGSEDVVAARGSQKGIVLILGNDARTILIDDVSKIYVDAISAGDAVTFNYYQT